ncbi:ABC-2 transporter permease [Salinicoccus halitifaciens]|uniref:ABC-2 transporter permease n=1 Tax=Salinicoccus halitifaciens TaxID=1073415 RepID=A0ABV2EAT4_9STAP|nr:ABC-2 transporter permease [Salinicoccus halitifaciens]MCD2137633.1 ABC-2 transporter permease [Salinicoccus halitifaciens]
MDKHFYLKLVYSKWTLIFTAIVIVLNLASALLLDPGTAGLMPVLNLANVFIVLYLTANYMNVHVLMTYNKSHEFFMALPVNKKEFIRTDYIFHIFMTLLSILVIFTFSLVHDGFHHLFGMIMITGVNLLIASLYYTFFAAEWFKNVNIMVALYLVPMGFTFMFYYMPMLNLLGADLSMIPQWEFILYTLPYFVLAAGILTFAVTYFTAQRQAARSDVI